MAGLDDPTVIDLVTEGRDGSIALIISHERAWTDSDEELDLLAEKINNYAAYALDEGLVSANPRSANRPKRVQVDCVTDPPARVSALLDTARSAMSGYSVDLVVNVLDQPRMES